MSEFEADVLASFTGLSIRNAFWEQGSAVSTFITDHPILSDDAALPVRSEINLMIVSRL